MEKTKQGMTTNEAAQMALQLSGTGKSAPKIAKILARNGYVSFKTGKPLTGSAVSNLITAARTGRTLMDKKIRMYNSTIGKYTPRSNGQQTEQAPPKAIAAPNLPLYEERVARDTMTIAMEKVLKSLFGVPARVLIPLDVSIRAPHA